MSDEEGSEGLSNVSTAPEVPRPLQIGDEIPNFTSDSHMGTITLHDLIDGSWGVILTFPRRNDPVVCTELGMLAKLAEEFEARKCKVLAIGVDSKFGHRAFIKETQELQDCQIGFPVVADASGEIMSLFGLVRPDAMDPARALVPQTCLFIVDLDRRVKMVTQYPSTVGQNYYETLRAIDAIQQATFNKVGVPANWKEGEDCFVDNEVPSSQAGQLFPKGFVELRPWFRITPQPDYE